jgi:hypothetical protein
MIESPHVALGEAAPPIWPAAAGRQTLDYTGMGSAIARLLDTLYSLVETNDEDILAASPRCADKDSAPLSLVLINRADTGCEHFREGDRVLIKARNYVSPPQEGGVWCNGSAMLTFDHIEPAPRCLIKACFAFMDGFRFSCAGGAAFTLREAYTGLICFTHRPLDGGARSVQAASLCLQLGGVCYRISHYAAQYVSEAPGADPVFSELRYHAREMDPLFSQI